MSLQNEKIPKNGIRNSEIFRLSLDLLYFFRKMQIVPVFFVLSVVCSFLATLFNFLGLKLLIPLLRGIIQGEFRTVLGNARPVAFLSKFFPHLKDNSLALFVLLLGIIFSSVIIKNMLDYAAALSIGQQIRRADRNIRKLVIDRYLKFGKLYYDRVNAATTSHIIMNAAGGVSGQLKPLHKLLSQLMTLTAYLAVMLWISWKLTLAVILIFPFFNYFTEKLIDRIRSVARTHELSQLNFFAKISNLISCIALVKTYSTEEREKKALSDVSDDEIRHSFEMQKKQQLVKPVQEITTMASLLIVTALMVFLAPPGGNAHTVSSYLVFFYIVRSAIPNLSAFSHFRLSVATAEAQITRLSDILQNDAEKFIVDSGSAEFSGLKNAIEFRNLNFSYRGKHPVLHDVSFEVPRGSLCAIVGPTGAGKSTLVNLLVRLYDCPSNSIFLDGADIRSFAIASLTERIGYVSQEPMLFNDTLRANICYGLDQVSEPDLTDALKKAKLDELTARLPEGLETVIGDRGMQLSGGERQRVSLARAFLKNPEILILDEATSALDTKTERSIQQAIDESRKQRTTIVIAHRLSTIVDADNVVVIEGGRVAEQGSFQELLENKGRLYEYWELQRAKEKNFLLEKPLGVGKLGV